MAEDGLASTTAFSSFIRYIGGWSQPSGRGLFMLRMMTTSFTAAAITGLGTAYATAAAFGPVASIGFAIGSCIGYVASVIFYWRTAMTTALTAFDDHPELMYLHLIRNYPTIGFQRVKMDSPEAQAEFRQKLRGNGIESLKLRCFMMSSWHTAAPGIEEVLARKEANLISRISEQG